MSRPSVPRTFLTHEILAESVQSVSKVARLGHLRTNSPETGAEDEPLENATKTILLWNAPHKPETLLFGAGKRIFAQQGCAYTNCELVLSPWHSAGRPVESYDAVVFNVIDDHWQKEMPRRRRPHQRYVFLTIHSPPVLKNYDDVIYRSRGFNWTMTYRKDADIPFVYGRVMEKRDTSSYQQVTGRPSFNKTRLVAWMASMCKTSSRREEYVRQLKQYVDVDVYGRCGRLRCDGDDLLRSHPSCYAMLEDRYKFYLSFENALCRDFVSEKFFEILGRRLVPVVYGGADYDDIAPPHSFIDARKYTPEQLAAYLKLLDANETLYNEYFEWKERYTVEYGLPQMARHGFCDLCRKLNEDQQPKTYNRRRMVSEWRPDKNCEIVEFIAK